MSLSFLLLNHALQASCPEGFCNSSVNYDSAVSGPHPSTGMLGLQVLTFATNFLCGLWGWNWGGQVCVDPCLYPTEPALQPPPGVLGRDLSLNMEHFGLH